MAVAGLDFLGLPAACSPHAFAHGHIFFLMPLLSTAKSPSLSCQGLHGSPSDSFGFRPQAPIPASTRNAWWAASGKRIYPVGLQPRRPYSLSRCHHPDHKCEVPHPECQEVPDSPPYLLFHPVLFFTVGY